MRKLITIIVVLAIAAAGTWWMAGRGAPAAIDIVKPAALVGARGELDLLVKSPNGQLSDLRVVIEQDGTTTPVFDLAQDRERLVQESEGTRLTQSIGVADLPALKAGPARLVINAARPALFGLRQISSSASKDLEVRLTPPTVGVQSIHHYVNHGGSEMVVYRVSADAATSGVRVGDYEYPGYPAAGAGIKGADAGLHVAFFALLWDQDPVNTPIHLFARDEVGNEAIASFDYRVFPKKFRESRITIDDRFLQKVVPAIVQNTPELKVANAGDLVASFLTINRDLRRDNNARITALAAQTAPQILWRNEFKQLVNTAVEAGFADQRTYVYNGESIDNQVHLGYDLASLSAAPVQASNRGKVLFAGWLGIYGNCVILDHGMGLQSLYAHLTSIDVKVGDMVESGGQLGRTGATGLAGGDHLHFTMLLNGNAVTPVDWWSAKWVKDRVLRKLNEAGGS